MIVNGIKHFGGIVVQNVENFVIQVVDQDVDTINDDSAFRNVRSIKWTDLQAQANSNTFDPFQRLPATPNSPPLKSFDSTDGMPFTPFEYLFCQKLIKE